MPSKPSSGFFMNSSGFRGKLLNDLQVSPSRPHELDFKAMEILHHNYTVKVIVVTCFLFSNSNVKKNKQTNKQNCANEFARDSRQKLSTDFSTVLQFETYLVK